MPIAFEEDIKKDIKSADFAPVYILFGEDSYLKKYYLDSIVKKICGDDTIFDYQYFTGDIDIQSVYDAVNQLPMAAPRKCVVIDDFDFVHASKFDYDRLCEIVSDVPESCVLIIKFDAVAFDEKRGNREKKIMSSAEKIGGKAVKLDHRTTAMLAKMLTSKAAKCGVTMPDEVSRYLIEISGDDINTLRFELDKLCDFAEGGTVSKDTVDLVCTKSLEASVYDYVGEIFKLNLSGALTLLDNMFFMRVEPMIILYTISSNYVDIYRMYAAGKAGVNVQTAAKDFGYAKRSFVLDRARRMLGKFDFGRIHDSFSAILAADRQLKSFGQDPRIILEELTVKLVYIIAAKGDTFDTP